MNPAKFHLADEQHPIRRDQMMMNGNRPSPLKINKGSYLIHKQPSSNSRLGMAASNKMQEQQQQYHHEQKQQQQQQQRQPVIIYTQSPKIIHTQARDFMALVQKLTGLSPPPPSHHDHDQVNQTDDPDQNATLQTQHSTANFNHSSAHEPRNHDHIHNNNIAKSVSCSHDDNDQSSSGLTDENCGGNENVHQGSSASGYSPMFSHPSPYYADIPLFTPASTDFFCSPRPLYRFSDSSSHPSPNVAGAISPSMFKFIKGLPEY